MEARKTFRVLAKSENRNGFGLRGVVLVAPDGEAWEVAAGSLHKPDLGADVTTGPERFTEYPYEIPRQLPSAPRDVVKIVWPKVK